MSACIKVTDYNNNLATYHELRLGVLNHQPSGVKANKCDLNLFSKYLKAKNINMITGSEMLRFIGWLRNERDNNPGTINRKESSIRSYIKYLRFAQIEGADAFPIESMPRARQPYSGPVDALSSDEVVRILKTIDHTSVLGYRDLTLYTMLYSLGLRIGEALSINMQAINFDNKTVQIYGKGRRKRKLPLTDDLIEIIENWLSFRSHLLNAGQLQALFISKKGNRLSCRTVQDNFKKIVEKAGSFCLEKITPHSLRHAFATHAIEGDQDLFVLKAIMGHASTKSTEIYLHPSMETLQKAVNEHAASEILNDLINYKIVPLKIHQARTS